MPKQFAVAQLIAANSPGAVNNYLRDAVVDRHDWGAPAGGLVAIGFPLQLAGLFVERINCGVALVIPQQHDGVAVQGGGGAFAEAVAHAHVAKILLPLQFALHVVAVQAAGAEADNDVLAIGHGGSGGITVITMMSFVRHLCCGNAPPVLLSGVSIEGHQHVTIFFGRLAAATETATSPAGASTTGAAFAATSSTELLT